MGLIGMVKAAEYLGVKARNAKHTLRRNGVPLIKESAQVLLVEEDDVRAAIARGLKPVGRPRKKSQGSGSI